MAMRINKFHQIQVKGLRGMVEGVLDGFGLAYDGGLWCSEYTVLGPRVRVPTTLQSAVVSAMDAGRSLASFESR